MQAMPGIPPALASDTEDVTWALQTAEALWKRNERSDALVWLRRAAQSAGEAEHDDRALALAHDAAELAEWIAGQPTLPGRSIRPSREPPATLPDEVEDVSIEVSIEMDPPSTLADDRPPSPPPAATSVPLVAATPVPARPPRMPSPPPVAPAHIPSAAEKHAGLLDPWADSVPPPATPDGEPEPPTMARGTARLPEVDEVITSAPPIPPAVSASKPLDLSGVEALSDLPDDARAALARAAVLRDIAQDEEISGFALALVLQGAVYLAATIVDTPAERLKAGEIMRARGTIDHVAPVRLVATTDKARIATWDERAVEQALRSCPWVEDELRAAGDRFQALVGVTMGPLGERLDPELRAQIASRLKVRALSEHEVFAAKGKPIPGLLVVGAGELEFVRDDGVLEGTVLRAGDFLFPNEVLVAAPAPTTARAAKGGALVLFAERHAAQELLMTCPPLLEIFAGS